MADIPSPLPEPDCVVVNVAACGICGSEIETYRKRSPRRQPPLVMGHEFCGTVSAVGPAVTQFKIGDRVISHSIVHCGRCAPCARGHTHLCTNREVFGMHRPGAFAEFVNVPARVLVPWPAALPREAAVLTEPLANGVHVNNLLAHVAGQNALVIGAGPIGLMCAVALIAKREANVRITDLNTDRLRVARELGAMTGPESDAAELRAWLKTQAGEGFDVIVDAVGSSATKRDSLELLRPGGACVWIGLHEDPVTLNSYEVTLPEKQILGTYAATMQELATAVQILASGRFTVNSLIKPRKLDDGLLAFEDALTAKSIKSVILPS